MKMVKNAGIGKRIRLVEDRYQKQNSRNGLRDECNEHGD